MKVHICKFLFLLIGCLYVTASCAQEYMPVYSSPAVYLDSTGRVVKEIDEKYFLEFLPGNVQQPYYNTIGKCGTIFVRERKSNRIHFLDRSGNWFNVAYPNLASISECSEGFHVGKAYGNKYFFYNTRGVRVFSQEGYDQADQFSEGLAAVKSNGRFFYINDLGHEVNIISSELKGIKKTFSFHDGLARIEMFGNGQNSPLGYRKAFINRSGSVVLNLEQLLPGKFIIEVSDFKDSICMIQYYKDHINTSQLFVTYIDTRGKEVFRIKNAAGGQSYHPSGTPVMIRNSKTPMGKIDSAYILMPLGKKKFFRPYQSQHVRGIFYLADDYYSVQYRDSVDASNTVTRIYSARLDKVRYVTKHEVRGVKWDLLSLYDPKEGRTYVVNMSTGQIVFDRDITSRVFTDLASTVLYKDKVRRYLCDDPSEISQLNQFKNLREVSFERMNIQEWNYNLKLPKLESIRFDSLMFLDSFPTHFSGLKKIAVRNCFRAQNVIQLVEGQELLEKIVFINMSVPMEDARSIGAQYPNAMVRIDGHKLQSTLITRDEKWDW
ncbi:MAG TPA: WG repeat-containing protein [Saprospiraceae bacterium]|nr:WG repeat-containing protein [Saprospiraceae bacterium]